jgi:C4-dicarboxylate-specific signal transduction histidine kinase
MLESAIRLCQIQYGPNHKMIKIEWELPSEPLTLWAPPQRVQQILVNLILNAYQIMGKEGTLSLGLAREEEWAVVRVGDTGPGIPENQMARLFEPFFTTKENGSGLGLALSQRIARECGGEIQAQNKESGGAAFVLRLPLEKKGTAS